MHYIHLFLFKNIKKALQTSGTHAIFTHNKPHLSWSQISWISDKSDTFVASDKCWMSQIINQDIGEKLDTRALG